MHIKNRYKEDLIREKTGHVSQSLTKFHNNTWKTDPEYLRLLDHNPFLTRNLIGSNEFGVYKFRNPQYVQLILDLSQDFQAYSAWKWKNTPSGEGETIGRSAGSSSEEVILGQLPQPRLRSRCCRHAFGPQKLRSICSRLDRQRQVRKRRAGGS